MNNKLARYRLKVRVRALIDRNLSRAGFDMNLLTIPVKEALSKDIDRVVELFYNEIELQNHKLNKP